MTTVQYKAIGFFLAYYERNLEHICAFQQYLAGNAAYVQYPSDKKNGFLRFLGEFRVARNKRKDKHEDLLALTVWWLKRMNVNDVNRFARRIHEDGLTHQTDVVSLASKILFLNAPEHIIPYDARVKATLGYKGNNYAEYLAIVKRESNSVEFSQCFAYVKLFAEQVEKKFKGKIKYLSKIRKNRMLDLWLWSKNGV